MGLGTTEIIMFVIISLAIVGFVSVFQTVSKSEKFKPIMQLIGSLFLLGIAIWCFSFIRKGTKKTSSTPLVYADKLFDSPNLMMLRYNEVCEKHGYNIRAKFDKEEVSSDGKHDTYLYNITEHLKLLAITPCKKFEVSVVGVLSEFSDDKRSNDLVFTSMAFLVQAVNPNLPSDEITKIIEDVVIVKEGEERNVDKGGLRYYGCKKENAYILYIAK